MRPDFLFPKIDLGITLTARDMEDLGRFLTPETVADFVAQVKAEMANDVMWQYGNQNFKDEYGKPWEMSPGELAIFRAIALRQHPRICINSCTQYGKTLTVSRAVLSRIANHPEPWLNVVPDTKRGRIMIRYMINDTANNQYFAGKLEGVDIRENNLLLRLLEEKSKVKLTYQHLGEDNQPRLGSVEIISAEARRTQDAINAVMGFGGRNIINDEASLIDDEIDAAIFRMMAGKGEDTFLCKIGNPIHRNQFMRTWQDPTYMKIFIEYLIALAEGRYTEGFVAEARQKPGFEQLYGGAFPPADMIDSEGWQVLISEDEVRMAMQGGAHFGDDRLGVDPGDMGTDESTIVRRSTGYAEIRLYQSGLDQMQVTGQTVAILEEPECEHIKDVYIDRIGVGAGSWARLREVNTVSKGGKWNIVGVVAGESVHDPNFANKRAEMAWRFREWIRGGGKLSNDPRWLEVCKVLYRIRSDRQVLIMSKDEMRKRGIPSPNVFDAAALTFADPTVKVKMSEDEKFFYKKMAENKRKAAAAAAGKGSHRLRMRGH